MQSSGGAALDGAQQAYAWFAGAMGNAHDHAALLLAGFLPAGAATAIAWLLVGGVVLGAGYKFRALFLYGFLFVTVYIVVVGLGVKIWG